MTRQTKYTKLEGCTKMNENTQGWTRMDKKEG